MKREVIRAKYSGFCYGVKRAIEMAEAEVEKHDKESGKRIYSCGPLIHNDTVTGELADKGLSIIRKIEEASEGDTVIIRSHGEAKAFYDEAEKRGINIIDATCPNVKKIHSLVHAAEEAGSNIVIVGDRNHAEVKGIQGWCNHAQVVGNAEEARAVTEDNLYVVAQTTIRKELFDEIIGVFEAAGKTIEIRNTICSATSERQKSCMETARKLMR